MNNKILIICTVVIVVAVGVIYCQKSGVFANALSSDNCLDPGNRCYYESWPQSSTIKSGDQLFIPLFSLSSRYLPLPDAYDQHYIRENTVLDFNGDGLNDVVLNYYEPYQKIVVVLSINNGHGGYDQYYKCAADKVSESSWKFYGDCAAN